MRWMVSYQGYDRLSGNRTFGRREEAEKFIAVNKGRWERYTLFTYDASEAVATLTRV